MHSRLKKYHSHGEWFAMNTDNKTHKVDMTAALEYAREYCSQNGPEKWERLDPAAIRKAVAELGAEQRAEERRKAKYKTILELAHRIRV